MYRSTPNPNCPDGKSAECLLGRKLRTPLDCMLPRRLSRGNRNAAMEHQFNLRHGAIVRSFHPGDSVLVRTYNCPSRWTLGSIIRNRGSVLYEVRVGSETWIRHANQLRLGVPSHQVDPTQAELQLDILLDSFCLKQHNQSNTERTPPHETRLPPEPSLQPRRWTDRTPKPVKPLRIDPRKKSYQ